MAKNYNYDHYKSVGEPATKVGFKKKRPKSVAVVDEEIADARFVYLFVLLIA